MRIHALSIGVVLATSLVRLHGASGGDTPYFTGLGGIGNSGSFLSNALDISGDGNVVVGYVNTGGNYRGAIRWTQQGGMELLRGITPFTSDMYAAGTTQDGSIVVGAGNNGAPGTTGFVWLDYQGGTVIDIGGRGAWKTSGDGGVIIGTWPNGAAKYENGQVTYLGDLSGGGTTTYANGVSGSGTVIAGRGESHNGWEAFRWEAGQLVGLGDLAGGSFVSSAESISTDGSTIVGYSNSTSGGEAFKWTIGDGMEGLGDLPGGSFNSGASDVSANGSVIVGNSDAGFAVRSAFIWDALHGMRDLKALLENEHGLDLSGWSLREANAVSGDGLTIVGNGINPSGVDEGWVAHLPEPSTAAFLASALLLGRRRRRTVPLSIC